MMVWGRWAHSPVTDNGMQCRLPVSLAEVMGGGADEKNRNPGLTAAKDSAIKVGGGAGPVMFYVFRLRNFCVSSFFGQVFGRWYGPGYFVHSLSVGCTQGCITLQNQRGLAKMFWLEINGYISGYISYGQWPDRLQSMARP